MEEEAEEEEEEDEEEEEGKENVAGSLPFNPNTFFLACCEEEEEVLFRLPVSLRFFFFFAPTFEAMEKMDESSSRFSSMGVTNGKRKSFCDRKYPLNYYKSICRLLRCQQNRFLQKLRCLVR